MVGALVLALGGCTGKTEETTTTEGDTETGIPPLDSVDGTATATTRGSATDTGVGDADGDSGTA